jgi:hypothetical protein
VKKPLKSLSLFLRGEVPLGLFDGIGGRGQDDVVEGPPLRDTGVIAVGRGEENVGVEGESIHRARRLRPLVLDRIGIESHLLDRLACSCVVLVVDRVGEKELSSPLHGVGLDGNGHCGAKEDALLRLLGDDGRPFGQTETAPQSCRDHESAPLPDPAGFRNGHDLPPVYLKIRSSDASVKGERKRREGALSDEELKLSKS